MGVPVGSNRTIKYSCAGSVQYMVCTLWVWPCAPNCRVELRVLMRSAQDHSVVIPPGSRPDILCGRRHHWLTTRRRGTGLPRTTLLPIGKVEEVWQVRHVRNVTAVVS
jgi:hypothetical protein